MVRTTILYCYSKKEQKQSKKEVVAMVDYANLLLFFCCLSLLIKKGVFNVLIGCDGVIEMSPGLTEETMGKVR